MKKQQGIIEQFNRQTGERRSEIKDYDRLIEYRGFDIIRNAYVPKGGANLWEIPELQHITVGGIKKGFATVSIIQSKEAIDKWFELNEELKRLK